MTLKYVEDYLEFLHGSMDKDGNAVAVRAYYSPTNPIKLASYDKSPVTSMGSFCSKVRSNNLESCLTDKQLELAKKIIFKYRRQLAGIGIALPENESDLQTKYQVRKIDRSKVLKYDADSKVVRLRFPYDPKKISELHDYTSNSAGHVEWSNDNKFWTFDLTEGNMVKILDLFKNEDLQIDNALEPFVVDIMKATEKDLPSISLDNDRMQLLNCHANVHSYLSNKGFTETDVGRLPYWVSQAAAMGLRVDESITDLLRKAYNENVVSIITNRKVTLPSNNQPDGEWYNALLEANSILNDSPWLLHLSWWSSKTNWKPFKNMQELPSRNRSSFKVEQNVADYLYANNDAIVVVDSVVGRDAIRNFIESNSLKVVYISDIGGSL